MFVGTAGSSTGWPGICNDNAIIHLCGSFRNICRNIWPRPYLGEMSGVHGKYWEYCGHSDSGISTATIGRTDS